MTPQEIGAFKLVDEYSRSKHNSFLAEMFLNDGKTEYVLCFRSLTTSRTGVARYLRIPQRDLETLSSSHALPRFLSDQLDQQLRILT